MLTSKSFACSIGLKILLVLFISELLSEPGWSQIPSAPTQPLRITEKVNGLVDFSPDGSKIVLIRQDGTVQVRDSQTNTTLFNFTLVNKKNVCLLWKQNGQHLGIFSQPDEKHSGQMQWWELDTGKPLTNITGIQTPLRSLQLSTNEHRLMTTSKGVAQSFDIETGRMLSTVRVAGSFFDKLMGELNIKWRADGRRLLTFRTEDITSVKMWDGETGRLIAELQEEPPNESLIAELLSRNHRPFSVEAAFTADGQQVLTNVSRITRNETAKVWSAETGKFERKEPLQQSTRESLFGRVAGAISDEGLLSPDGKTILRMKEGKFELLEVGSLRLKATLPLNGCQSFHFISEAACLPPSFHPSKPMLMIQYFTYVTLWNSETGTQIIRLPNARGPAKFSPNGRWLVTQSKDQNVMLWEVIERF